MKEYKPIACHLHDHIEHFATLRKVVNIQYVDSENNTKNIKSIIKDWVNNGNGEFIVLKESDLNIRFDNIVSIDKIDFLSSNVCNLN